MSSILKRLRETADMRELGYTRRDRYRNEKWLAQHPDAAKRYFARAPERVKSEHKEHVQKRSELALQQLSGGVTLRSFAKAMKVFIQGKV